MFPLTIMCYITVFASTLPHKSCLFCNPRLGTRLLSTTGCPTLPLLPPFRGLQTVARQSACVAYLRVSLPSTITVLGGLFSKAQSGCLLFPLVLQLFRVGGQVQCQLLGHGQKQNSQLQLVTKGSYQIVFMQ